MRIVDDKQQLIENCNRGRFLKMSTLSSSAAPMILAAHISVEGIVHTEQERLDFYNSFVLNLNLQIYEEIKGKIEWEIVGKDIEVDSFRLSQTINIAQLECWVEEEIRENLAIPMINDFVELNQNRRLQFFQFVSMAPIVKDNVIFLTRMNSIKI